MFDFKEFLQGLFITTNKEVKFSENADGSFVYFDNLVIEQGDGCPYLFFSFAPEIEISTGGKGLIIWVHPNPNIAIDCYKLTKGMDKEARVWFVGWQPENENTAKALIFDLLRLESSAGFIGNIGTQDV